MTLTAAIVMVACNAPNGTDEATKRLELQQYKQQRHDLDEKIASLEAELQGIDKVEVVNVKVQELQTQTFEHFIEVNGKVEAELDLEVSPESSGVITDVFVTEGQQVPKGFVMGRLNTDILQRSMEELEIQLELAATNYKRQQNLWDQNIGSEMQLLQAKNSKEGLDKRIESIKTQIEMSEIKSPISGVVDVVYQKRGNIASTQIPFAKVVNISQIKIYADISESYLTKVKKGDQVTVYFPALNQETEATIQQIANTIDPNNRTFRVRINMGNPGNRIKPNLISIVKIRDYRAENAIVVPSLFIKEDFTGNYTYIVVNADGKTTAKKIYVKPGVTQNNTTEVIEGLDSGMKIISEGYDQISDGTVISF